MRYGYLDGKIWDYKKEIKNSLLYLLLSLTRNALTFYLAYSEQNTSQTINGG